MNKISTEKKYRTRDGREVRIYAVDGTGNIAVHGAILNAGKWVPRSWFEDGSFYQLSQTDEDLIEVRPRIKREVWVNVYPSDRRYGCHSSRIGADEGGTADRIACVKIVIDCEEGEGL